MPALPLLPPDQVEAAIRALRLLGTPLKPGVLDDVREPFNPRAEIDAFQSLIEAILDDAPTVTLNRLLATMSEDERMSEYPAEIRRIETSLYKDALVRRGERAAAVHPVTRKESDQARLQTYRFVNGTFLSSLPDQQLIDANRRAYARWLDLAPNADDPRVARERDALQLVMDTLGAIMDASGVTDRFVSGLPTAGGIN